MITAFFGSHRVDRHVLGDDRRPLPGLARAFAAIAGAALALTAFAPTPARAQCSAGDVVGACPAGVGYEGCCGDSGLVNWCENGSLCEIDCSFNQGGSCCQASLVPGCCDSAITQCVCDIDPYCCDADPFLPGGVWDDFCVEYAQSDCGGCAGSCSGPANYCGWRTAEGYYDCMSAPSGDPTGAHPMQCGGSSCTANCAGKSCGSDGCGGSCGNCGPNAVCTGTGQCQATCTPNCAGKSCGPDGCGSVCGNCGPNQSCVSGQCESACTPSCAGKVCGDDGCGGTCGSCGPNSACVSGQCEAACAPNCGGKQCGDDGCGGSCGSCGANESCSSGICKSNNTCTPDCAGKVCGDDGCEGSCGECDEGETCTDGECVSGCSCVGKQCGNDGCGRVCGYCGPGTECNTETFKCDTSTPVEQPDAGTTDPENCPQGQIWDAYASACVIDTRTTTNGVGKSAANGCATGNDAATGLALAALGLGLIVASRRRRVA